MLEDGKLTRLDTKDVFLYLTVTVRTFYLDQRPVFLNEFFSFSTVVPLGRAFGSGRMALLFSLGRVNCQKIP